MHKFVSLNGKIVEGEQALVPAASSAVLYGRSVFTTIAVRERNPLFWDKHWARLTENAAKLGIELFSFSHDDVESSLLQLLKANEVIHGRARVTMFDEAGISLNGESKRTGMLITTADLRDLPEDFKITVSPFPINSRSSLAGVKSGNYLEKIIAIDEARSRGFDEAVVLNERDEVASGVMSNVFWLKNGGMRTPSLKTGCLAGTTRAFVMENCDCEEVEGGIDELRNADAIYLTSAGIGIVQVSEFEGRRLPETSHRMEDLFRISG